MPAESFSEQEAFLFELTLEIREREEQKKGGGGGGGSGSGSGGGGAAEVFEGVPRQKGVFKLRSGAEKKVVITVRQITRHNACSLTVERCFGMLVSPGRNVRHADMQLLEQVTMATTAGALLDAQPEASRQRADGITHVLTGTWDPSETAFAVLNRETPPDVSSVFVTIAADLVISQARPGFFFFLSCHFAQIYVETLFVCRWQSRSGSWLRPAAGFTPQERSTGTTPGKIFASNIR